MNETEKNRENFRQRCAVLQDENASERFTVPMEKTATKKQGNKKTRIALVIALSLVLLAVIALGGVSVYYRSAFLPGTVINGYDCGGVSEAGAAEFLLGTAKSHAAQLRDARGDAIVALPLESFVDADGFTAALEEYFDAQHAEAGLFGWMMKGERSLETGVYTVSDTAAASELLSRVLYDETPRQAPADARIVLGEDGYTVDPGSKGNLVNLANCVSAMAEQLPAVRDLREALGRRGHGGVRSGAGKGQGAFGRARGRICARRRLRQIPHRRKDPPVYLLPRRRQRLDSRPRRAGRGHRRGAGEQDRHDRHAELRYLVVLEAGVLVL